jgi:plastocyanin
MLKTSTAVLVAGVALVAAGCGGDDDEGAGTGTAATTQAPATAASGGSGGALRLTSPESGALEYDRDSLEAGAGSVRIDYRNPSPVPHNVSVKGDGLDAQGEVVQNGTSTVTADLQPGTYTFYCSVPGHEAAGMKGTLTVR